MKKSSTVAFVSPAVAARSWEVSPSALRHRAAAGKIARAPDPLKPGQFLYALAPGGLKEPKAPRAEERFIFSEDQPFDGDIPQPTFGEEPEDGDPRVEMVVCFSDVHIPNHDVRALETVMLFIADQQPDRIILNGDIIDLESASLHPGAPSDRKVPEEIAAGNEFLDRLQAIAPNATIHYNMGNHETRFERYVGSRAPHLRGLTTIEKELRFKERGITTLPYGEVHFVGNLGFTHGVFHNDFYTKNHLVKYGTSLVLGHTHRPQMYTMGVAGKDGSQKVRGAFGLPCLAPVGDCEYIKGPTGWMNGFGVFMVEKESGEFTPSIVIMNHGRFWWGRKRYG